MRHVVLIALTAERSPATPLLTIRTNRGSAVSGLGYRRLAARHTYVAATGYVFESDRMDSRISVFNYAIQPADVLGEWRGGVSPPRSLRTGREPLGSSGSQYPTVGMEKRPVREELWVDLDDTGEPLTRALRL